MSFKNIHLKLLGSRRWEPHVFCSHSVPQLPFAFMQFLKGLTVSRPNSRILACKAIKALRVLTRITFCLFSNDAVTLSDSCAAFPQPFANLRYFAKNTPHLAWLGQCFHANISVDSQTMNMRIWQTANNSWSGNLLNQSQMFSFPVSFFICTVEPR